MTCPCCGAEAGRATFSTAPGQLVCADPECPVNTWNEGDDPGLGVASLFDAEDLETFHDAVETWGIDVRYRMLQPDELKQAQGFPADYELVASTKENTKKLIGNAVPVNLARELARHLLADETPSLSTYGGGLQERDVDVPQYEEVASDDD